MSAVVRKNKTSEVSLYLFGKPAWELELEGQDVDLQMASALRVLGDQLRERLYSTSDALAKLVGSGWAGSDELYDIVLYKDITVDEAEKELRGLGIDPESVSVNEEEWDEEE
jgi:hypothetical protein